MKKIVILIKLIVAFLVAGTDQFCCAQVKAIPTSFDFNPELINRFRKSPEKFLLENLLEECSTSKNTSRLESRLRNLFLDSVPPVEGWQEDSRRLAFKLLAESITSISEQVTFNATVVFVLRNADSGYLYVYARDQSASEEFRLSMLVSKNSHIYYGNFGFSKHIASEVSRALSARFTKPQQKNIPNLFIQEMPKSNRVALDEMVELLNKKKRNVLGGIEPEHSVNW